MVDRRGIILGTLSLAIAPFIVPHLSAAGSDSRTRPHGLLALYDPALPQAVAFASQLAQAGILAHDTGRDVARLLYGQLSSWAEDPGIGLVGITGYADYLVAAGIGAEARRSVRYAMLHTPSGARLIDGAAFEAIPGRAGILGEAFSAAIAISAARASVAWFIGARTLG